MEKGLRMVLAVGLLTVGITTEKLRAEPSNGSAPSAKATSLPKAPKGKDYAGQLAEKLTPDRAVVYKTVGDRELRLYIFEPQGFKPTDRRPCFLTIHGGGWTGLGPYRQYPFAAHFARLGMVGVCIEYRLLRRGAATVFDCVKDARSAVRYVRAHAAELGIDPQKIVVNGGSAGGHLAAATALFCDVDGLDEQGENTSVSCEPNALVLYFPVIDTSQDGYGQAKIGERWRDLSPLHHVRPGAPPTLLLHGTADTVTPYAGAVAFTRAMREAGNHCELVPTEGGDHGYLMRSRDLYDQAVRRTEKFLAAQKMMP